MTIDVQIPEGLTRFMRALKPAGRHQLFSAAADAVSKLINDHLRRIAPGRHKTADRLGATPTNHLQKRTSFSSDSDSATVTIPIPGIVRAFKDLLIRAKNKPFLTLPLSAVAYGKRAVEVRSLGYRIFRPAAKGSHKQDDGKFSAYQDLLMGSKEGEVIPLYLLKKQVKQRRDPTLLPTMEQIGQTAASAMIMQIQRYAKGAV